MAFWPIFLLATAITVLVLNLLFYLREFLDYLLVYQAGILNSFRLLLYIQPSFLVLAIPIGFLVAVLLVYGRLSSDRELMAIESCGFSAWVVIWPMIVASVLFSFFLVVFMDLSLPWGNVSFLKLQYKILSERSAIVIREGVFISDFKGYNLLVRQKDDRKDTLKGVTVEMLDEKGRPYRIVNADEGLIYQDRNNYHTVLGLREGSMQQLGTQKNPKMDELFQIRFKACALDLSVNRHLGGPIDFRSARNSSSMRDLTLRIRQGRAEKRDTRIEEVDFHKKFSIPFSTLAFAFIGIPLGLMSRIRSFLSVLFAVVLVAIYEGFIIYGETVVGTMGSLSPLLAMWLPNLVLVCVGLVLVHCLNHRLDFWKVPFFKKRNPDLDASKFTAARVISKK
jgi:lipopolysaccharide export system permease protein